MNSRGKSHEEQKGDISNIDQKFGGANALIEPRLEWSKNTRLHD